MSRHDALLKAVLLATVLQGLSNQQARAEVPRVATDKWVRIETPTFEVLTNASERSARDLVEQLETFRATLQQLMPDLVHQAREPIHVLLFARHNELRNYLPRNSEGKPREMAALYVGGQGEDSLAGDWIALSNDVAGEVPGVVLHEFAHFLLNQNLGDIPLWFNEGLAEFYSTFHYQTRAHKAEIGRPIVDHVRWLAQTSSLGTAALLAVDSKSPDYNEGVRQGSFYAKSWLLIHYLSLGSPADAKALVEFQRLRATGLSDLAALEKAIGRPLSKLDDELYQYQRKSLMKYRVFDLQPLDPEFAGKASPAAPELILLRLGQFLNRLGIYRTPEAAEHFAEIRSRSPGSALADLGEAEAHVFFGTPEKALPVLRRARAADPSLVPAARLLGLTVARLMDGARPEETVVDEGRAALATVLASDPARRTDWLLFASLHRFETPPSAKALAAARGLDAALARFAGDAELATALAGLFLVGGEPREATRIAGAGLAGATRAQRRELERVLYNVAIAESNDLLQKNEEDAAIVALQQGFAGLTDPTLRAQMRYRIGEVEKAAKERRDVARYNEAIRLANAGLHPQALEILKQVLAQEPEPALADATRKLIEQIEAFLARSKRR